MSPRALPLALAFAICVFPACRKAEITSYRVPKEPEPAETMAPANPHDAATPAATPPMASTPVETASGLGLTWKAPADWTQKPAAQMRKATFGVPGSGGEAELSITAFPNAVGGETANLNRWRGQVGLSAQSDAELANSITRFSANGLAFTVADFSNPQAPASGSQHIVGAIVPFEGATWFFKLSGADTVVAGAKPAFLEFLKTVKPSAP